MAKTTDRANGSTKSAPQKREAKRAKASSDDASDLEREAASPHEIASDAASPDVMPLVGSNLRQLRKERTLSLEGLSKASGVSRAMLGQIELGQSVPTINVLWKISRALGVPFSALITTRAVVRTQVLPLARARILTSHDGAFRSRALFPADGARTVEFYELRLAARSREEADAHPPGTRENLVVQSGSLDLHLKDEVHRLGTGDAILFDADAPHVYENTGKIETVMYLVMTYTRPT